MYPKGAEALADALDGLNGSSDVKTSESLIDLSSPCRLPFSGVERITYRNNGIIKLEKRGDDLYLDEKKATLFLSEQQKGGGRVVGKKLWKEIEARGGNVSAKVLDYLEDHPELWPESWKKDKDSNTIFVFFWNDIFSNPSNGNLYVRRGYWDDGRVVSNYNWLDNDWNSNNPAASVAS